MTGGAAAAIFRGLLSSAALSLGPIVPHTHIFQFLIEAAFMHTLLNLGAVQAWTDAITGIRQCKRENRRLGHMLLKLREIYLIERISGGMIVFQIIRFVLVGNKCGHTFEHEVEMVGA